MMRLVSAASFLLVTHTADAFGVACTVGVHKLAHCTSARIMCCTPAEAEASDDPSMTIETCQSMFADVRTHYRTTGEVDEGQVCRNMMVTRINDFANRINRCCVRPSNVHGDGLFATRSIAVGELVTFWPGDALLVWEDGQRASSDMMMFFGAHIPQEERDAGQIANERVAEYELYSSPKISAVGDPTRRDDPSYLGHFVNDAATCASPDGVAAYRRDSAAAANVEAVLLEGCHFALRALRPIDADAEILASYGEGYWLSRNGHAGVGADLRRVGTAPPSRDQSARLKEALQRARPQKKVGSGGKGGKKAKGKKKKATGSAGGGAPPAARGFGSS